MRAPFKSKVVNTEEWSEIQPFCLHQLIGSIGKIPSGPRVFRPRVPVFSHGAGFRHIMDAALRLPAPATPF